VAFVLLVGLCAAQQQRPAVADTAPPAEPLEAEPPLSEAAAPPSAIQPDEPVPKRRLRLGVALRAARPWSFPATISPVLFGSALAFQVEDRFGPLKLLLTLGTTLSVHAAGNLMNTLFDYGNGYDDAGSSDQTLVSGALDASQAARLIGVAYGVAAACLVPLALLSSAPAWQLGLSSLLGAASAYVYTGGPGLKYKALGDVLISVTFGPLLVGFSYLAQCHGFPGVRVLLPALVLAAPIEAILHANNARDVDEDARNGVRTLAQMLGPRASFGFYAGLMAVPFAYSAVQAWRRSLLGALPLLAAPLARKLVAAFRRGDFVDLPKKTAKFQAVLGTLMVAAALLPSPALPECIARVAAILGATY